MRRPVLSLLALPLAALSASGCGGPRSDTPLFPLDAGHRWTYRVSTEFENNTSEREELTVRTLGRADIDGQPTWQRRSETGVDYWLRSDASGIFRVASKTDLDAEPKADSPPRYVLKAPYVAGTQWQSTTTAYLLQRRNDFPREIRHTHPSLPMLYQIEATDVPVETPAGKFEHCLRVKGVATVRLYADATSGWKDLPLTTLEWYCPGVGLARLERNEPAGAAFLVGGTLKMELSAWQ